MKFTDYATEEGEVINFDSYMVPSDDLVPGSLRLLEVDNRVVLPVKTHVRFNCYSSRCSSLLGNAFIRC